MSAELHICIEQSHSDIGGGELLTDSDCCHHWRHNHRKSDSTGDHKVPLVLGDIFALIAVMDLQEGSGAK